MWAAEFCTREGFVWESKEERVAKVQVGCDEAVDKNGCTAGSKAIRIGFETRWIIKQRQSVTGHW